MKSLSLFLRRGRKESAVRENKNFCFLKRRDYFYDIDDILKTTTDDQIVDFRERERFVGNKEEVIKTNFKGRVANSINIPADSLLDGTKLKVYKELALAFNVSD